MVDRPAQGAAEVVLLDLEPVLPRPQVAQDEVRLGGLDELPHPIGVAAFDVGELGGGGQPLGGVLPRDPVHRVADLSVGLGGPHEVGLDELGQAAQDRQFLADDAATDLLGGLERPASGEHRHGGEQAARRCGQQVVAPVEGRPLGPLAGGGVTLVTLEDRQRMLQPCMDHLGRDVADLVDDEPSAQRHGHDLGPDCRHRACP